MDGQRYHGSLTDRQPPNVMRILHSSEGERSSAKSTQPAFFTEVTWFLPFLVGNEMISRCMPDRDTQLDEDLEPEFGRADRS